MAKAVKSTQDDLLFIKVKAIMVTGDNDSRKGNIHNIIVFPNNQEHMVIPSRFFNSLRSTIERVMSSNNIHDQKFTIDTALKDEDSLCDDLSSLGLSIAIGIEACLNDWKEAWENVWEEWCFTGEVKDSQGEIGAIGGAREKLESATDDETINYIMIPFQNRQEIINWIDKRKDINYEVNTSRNISIKDTGNSPSFFSRIWSLSTRNTFMWIALILWFLSITYTPTRHIFRDNIQSFSNGNSQLTINLPIKDPERVKQRLLNNGFPEDRIKNIPFSSLTKTNQIGKALITNRNGAIEFEIINSQDWTLISSYICGGYIALFAFILVVLALRANKGNTKPSTGNINYDSLLLTNRNKEIMFIDNIKQAEAIVEHKIH